MKKPPSDVKFLRAIYNLYHEEFLKYENDSSIRSGKNYVPIDVKEVGKKLDYDPELVFGRLYYHLEKKYGYKNDDKTIVHFFGLNVGGDPHCIHFPYLAAILANMEEDTRKFNLATGLSIAALVISVATAILATITTS